MMVKTIIDEPGFTVLEAEPDDFTKFLQDEFKGVHPITIVKALFREDVMEIIGSDHHKSRDGIFTVSYDHYAEKWYFSHPGYVRDDIEVESKHFIDAAQKFISKVRRANAKVLNGQIEDEVNAQLPETRFVELDDTSITLYETERGEDRLRSIMSADVKGKSAAEILERIKESDADRELI